MENNQRDYASMDIKELVEAIIRDSKLQGTITYPFRTEGYHTCCNVMFTDRL